MTDRKVATRSTCVYLKSTMRYDLSGMSEDEIAYFKEHGYPRQTPEVQEWMQDYATKLNIELSPNQAFIDQRFKESRDRANQLFSRDHDANRTNLKAPFNP